MFGKLLNLDDFIFPTVATIIYWIGLVVIVIGGLIGALTALAGGNGFLGFIFAIVGAIIGLIFWRIAMELWTVLFAIYGVLKDIRDKPRV